MTNPVDAAIAAAKAMAEKTAPANQIDMVQTTGPSGLTGYVAPKVPSLSGLTQGTMTVDGYLKVKEFGLLVMGKTDLVDTIRVAIVPNQMQPFTGIRFQVGQAVNYLKTYDGTTCTTGGSWAEAVARAQTNDPKARPYEGADISMRLLADVKHPKGGVLAEAGQVLGHSTSITNRALLADFIKEATAMNAMDDELEVEIGFVSKTNKNGQNWGLVTFKIIGVLGAE